MDARPPLTIEESLALAKEYRERTLNKYMAPACVVWGGSIEDKMPPRGYRIISEGEKTGEWVELGLMWLSTTKDDRGVRTCWEHNVDEKGFGIYTEPGHIYAIPV